MTIMVQRGNKRKIDEILTPRYAVEPIVKYLKTNNFEKIWCPFDKEDSQFVRVLKREGFTVYFSHIDDGNDFFQLDPPDCDCIVSAPPLSKKCKVLSELYEIGKPFMMLLPVPVLQGKKQGKLFSTYGIELLVFNKRIGYHINNDFEEVSLSSTFGSMYFCHNVLPDKIVFEELEVVQESYLE